MSDNFKYIVTDAAQEEITNIKTYYAVECNNVQAADKIIESIKEKIRKVCLEPMLYQIDSNPTLAKKGIRKIPVEGYVIYYKIDFENKLIKIGRIRNERQNNSRIKV